MVIGVEIGGKARAYRLGALDDPSGHLVNDTIGGVPLTVAYCNLSQSAQIYTNTTDGQAIDVEVVGLRDHQMVIKVAGYLYFHPSGLPVEPEKKPPPLPCGVLTPMVTTWKAWTNLHPKTDVYLGHGLILLCQNIGQDRWFESFDSDWVARKPGLSRCPDPRINLCQQANRLNSFSYTDLKSNGVVLNGGRAGSGDGSRRLPAGPAGFLDAETLFLLGWPTWGMVRNCPAEPGPRQANGGNLARGRGWIPMAFRRCSGWYVRIRLRGSLLVPPLLWLVVVLVAPTGWARRQIVAQIESRSGRRVTLDGVSVGLMGGIRLTNLEIGSPQETDDPWLKAADIRLDFGLFHMLGGHCRPTRLEADGVELRVLRRGDGTIELADLIRPVPAPHATGSLPAPEDRVTVQLHRARVTVVDEPTQTRVQLEDVEGQGYREGPLAVIEQLRGTVNGGEFRFAARIDRTASALAAEAQLRADDVAINDGVKVLRYVVPVLGRRAPPTAVKGRLNADIYVQGRGPTWPRPLPRTSVGQGNVAAQPGRAGRHPAGRRDLPLRRKPGGACAADRLDPHRLCLQVPKSHDRSPHAQRRPGAGRDVGLDGPGRPDRLPDEDRGAQRPSARDQARRILDDLKLDVGSLTALTLRGSLDQMVVQVNGVPIDGNLIRESRLRPDDRERLRGAMRQLRDKILR